MITKILLVNLVLFFFLMGCGRDTDSGKSDAAAQTVAADFRAQLTAAVQKYLEVKDALVAGDDAAIAVKSAALKEAVGSVAANLLAEEQQQVWLERVALLNQVIDSLAVKQDIMEQRAVFRPLSEALIGCVKDYGPLEMPLYVQHCPMAFQYQGGDWLSASEEVLNPYFGKMMLRCGEVTEKIVAGK